MSLVDPVATKILEVEQQGTQIRELLECWSGRLEDYGSSKDKSDLETALVIASLVTTDLDAAQAERTRRIAMAI